MEQFLQTIDLREKFEGHVVLWAKGWYKTTMLDTLYERQRAWAAMPDNWKPHLNQTLALLISTLELVNGSKLMLAETIARSFAIENSRITSYNLQEQDKIQLVCLLYAYSSVIACCEVNTENQRILLPDRV